MHSALPPHLQQLQQLQQLRAQRPFGSPPSPSTSFSSGLSLLPSQFKAPLPRLPPDAIAQLVPLTSGALRPLKRQRPTSTSPRHAQAHAHTHAHARAHAHAHAPHAHSNSGAHSGTHASIARSPGRAHQGQPQPPSPFARFGPFAVSTSAAADPSAARLIMEILPSGLRTVTPAPFPMAALTPFSSSASAQAGSPMLAPAATISSALGPEAHQRIRDRALSQMSAKSAGSHTANAAPGDAAPASAAAAQEAAQSPSLAAGAAGQPASPSAVTADAPVASSEAVKLLLAQQHREQQKRKRRVRRRSGAHASVQGPSVTMTQLDAGKGSAEALGGAKAEAEDIEPESEFGSRAFEPETAGAALVVAAAAQPELGPPKAPKVPQQRPVDKDKANRKARRKLVRLAAEAAAAAAMATAAARTAADNLLPAKAVDSEQHALIDSGGKVQSVATM